MIDLSDAERLAEEAQELKGSDDPSDFVLRGDTLRFLSHCGYRVDEEGRVHSTVLVGQA